MTDISVRFEVEYIDHKLLGNQLGNQLGSQLGSQLTCHKMWPLFGQILP
jgi:hypothetical protein